jgi:hypothetical protein
MKKISRVFLFGALALVLLLAGCGGQEETATPVGTTQPGAETSVASPTEAVGTAETMTTGTAETTSTAETSPTPTEAATATATAQAQAPVTGGDINVLECQFCIGTTAYALLDIPAVATFEITDPASPDPDTQCNTADTFNDRQVVLCRAPQETSLTLNVCTDANTCSEVTVDLQPCPLAAATAQPGVSATKTPTSAAEATATATGAAGTPSATPTTAGGATATPTP